MQIFVRLGSDNTKVFEVEDGQIAGDLKVRINFFIFSIFDEGN